MFSYLIDKINEQDFKLEPFKHIYIENFFNDSDFKKIITSNEINLSRSENDNDLFDRLFRNNYQIVNFPGCVTSQKHYIDWHENDKTINHSSACESAGMTLRLNPNDSFLKKVSNFFTGEKFNQAIAKKFNFNYDDCYSDGGIQKYLDGYEISPHPDIRRKAATFMVNINPHNNSESLNHHTHYLKFNKEKEYIKHFWEGNKNAERPWVPWEWCKTSFIQTKNNSIVIFSPSHETLHAVKADYDHLVGQRTQLYGNLWYSNHDKKDIYSWEDFDRLHDINALHSKKNEKRGFKQILSNILPKNILTRYKKFSNSGNYYHRDND